MKEMQTAHILLVRLLQSLLLSVVSVCQLWKAPRWQMISLFLVRVKKTPMMRRIIFRANWYGFLLKARCQLLHKRAGTWVVFAMTRCLCWRILPVQAMRIRAAASSTNCRMNGICALRKRRLKTLLRSSLRIITPPIKPARVKRARNKPVQMAILARNKPAWAGMLACRHALQH